MLLLLASFRGWIPQRVLPLQSLLVMGSLVLLGVALVFQRPFHPGQIYAAVTLHPITSIIAGFLLAGAVESAGGFAAASRLLVRMGNSVLGLPGVIVVLVNIPNIFAMPCGRIWAAALVPVALTFGSEVARLRNQPSLVAVIVFGLIINAAASCGPSPLGGIGMMGEGTAGLPLNAFSNPQQIAIMVMTLVTMASSTLFLRTSMRPCEFVVVRDLEVTSQIPSRAAYAAFFLYLSGMAVIFITNPPVPIQALLLGMTAVVMIIGKVSFKDLFAGIILHPVTAMTAGFVMAGALMVAGGFDAMTVILTWLATHTYLGFLGVGILLVYLPAIIPMPCGRILAAALLPGVVLFAEVVSRHAGQPQIFPAMLIAFILTSAASCGPSPLGGIGGIGEGNLGLPSGASILPMQFGMLLAAPIASLVVTSVGLSLESFRLNETILSLSAGVLSGVTLNVILRFPFYHLGGILGGALVGVVIMIL